MVSIEITKQDGTREPFEMAKLEGSLRRAGASDNVIRDISAAIEASLRDGMTTSEIYRHAFRLLKSRERVPAARYSMKRAILELGPSGFPFEEFVAELFRARGYDATTKNNIEGACAVHEVDLIAKKGSELIGAEVKFHNLLGLKSDLKTALYVHARFEDLKESNQSPGKDITERLLITNTKFSTDALQYGKCRNLSLISWSYPEKGNLEDLIEESKLHPVTALTSLSRGDKLRLLQMNMVLCKTIAKEKDVLRELGFSQGKAERVYEESARVCGI